MYISDFPMMQKKKAGKPKKMTFGSTASSYFSEDSSSISTKSSFVKHKATRPLAPAFTPHNSAERIETSSDEESEEVTLGTPARSRASSEESAQVHRFSLTLKDLHEHMAFCMSNAPKAIARKPVQEAEVVEDAVVPWGNYAK